MTGMGSLRLTKASAVNPSMLMLRIASGVNAAFGAEGMATAEYYYELLCSGINRGCILLLHVRITPCCEIRRRYGRAMLVHVVLRLDDITTSFHAKNQVQYRDPRYLIKSEHVMSLLI